jgi:hypothetical protein
MRDNFRNIVSNRFTLIWGLGLVLVVVILGGRSLSTANATPSLEQVLSSKIVSHVSATAKTPPMSGAPDFALVVVSLLAMSLATMSAAKGYEIFRRNRSLSSEILSELPSLPQLSEETAALEIKVAEKEDAVRSMRKHIEQLNKGKDWLQQENSGLKEKVGSLTSGVEEISRAEKMLRKSNVSLSKECERLKAENEMLLLKVSSLAIKPQRNVGKVSKTAAKAAVKNKRKMRKK